MKQKVKFTEEVEGFIKTFNRVTTEEDSYSFIPFVFRETEEGFEIMTLDEVPKSVLTSLQIAIEEKE